MDNEQKRLYWQSRRGMLELDLVLTPFAANAFGHLDAADKKRYEALLDCEDQDLFVWLMGREEPQDADLKRIIGLIREYARNNKS
jgi:antitoxin CptB